MCTPHNTSQYIMDQHKYVHRDKKKAAVAVFGESGSTAVYKFHIIFLSAMLQREVRDRLSEHLASSHGQPTHYKGFKNMVQTQKKTKMIFSPETSCFTFFINDLDDGAECNFSNAKLGRVANMPEGCAAIWRDLDRLEKWAARNLMKFSKGNCEGLQLGRNHPTYPYVPWAAQQEGSLAENDLGVLVDTRLNRVHLRSKVEIGGHLGHSDHEAIEFEISVIRRKSASKTSTLDIMRAEFRLLRELGFIQCPELEDHDCTNEQFPVNPEIFWDVLLQLDPYKSMGPYGIHPRILKDTVDVIAKPFLIFVLSWEPGEVPANWNLANVVPVFKKEKKQDPRNYRPVSLTSVPGKNVKIIVVQY
ncbi:hypothetical protein WISP_78132 [Willisornis vidua]|uniref:Endonuclease/exonuclease/phosphatase domain-containing protein n=1 Tax=Willisornis vidua TaxID=1566151 RepID=A0ABQ9D6R8_9PASS|nr:hypothetical protein WISP_78132 [Willisornis vidua]